MKWLGRRKKKHPVGADADEAAASLTGDNPGPGQTESFESPSQIDRAETPLSLVTLEPAEQLINESERTCEPTNEQPEPESAQVANTLLGSPEPADISAEVGSPTEVEAPAGIEIGPQGGAECELDLLDVESPTKEEVNLDETQEWTAGIEPVLCDEDFTEPLPVKLTNGDEEPSDPESTQPASIDSCERLAKDGLAEDTLRYALYAQQFGELNVEVEQWVRKSEATTELWCKFAERALELISACLTYFDSLDEGARECLTSRINSLSILSRMIERSIQPEIRIGPVEDVPTATGEPTLEDFALNGSSPRDLEDFLARLQAQRWTSLDMIRLTRDQQKGRHRSFLEKQVLRISDSIISGISAVLEAGSEELGTNELADSYKEIERLLMLVLNELGIELIGADPGELFDGQLHEALSTEPRADLTNDTVIEVLNPGYKLRTETGDQVLRCASVVVVSNSRVENVNA